MRCEEMLQKLEAFIDGELAVTEKQAVDEHLRTCQTCRNGVARRLQLRQAALEAFAVRAPDELRLGISHQAATTPRRSVRRRVFMVALAAAATVIMAIGIGVQRRGRSPEPAPFERPAAVIVIGAVEEPLTPGRLVLAGQL